MFFSISIFSSFRSHHRLKCLLSCIVGLIALFGLDSTLRAQSAYEDQLRLIDRDDLHSIHKKLYTKRGRHEISLGLGGIPSHGGYGLATASYTYHMFENLGFEAASGGWAFQTNTSGKFLFYQGSLAFSPLYGKLSLFTWGVANFDIYVIGGAGVVSYTNQTLGSSFMGNIGLGQRFFINDFLSVRVEYRDYLYKQNVLNSARVLHNHAIVALISLMLPLRPQY